MEHVWSLLCSKAIIDQQTKMVSLIEALDAIEVSGQFPEVDPNNPPNIGPVSIQIVSFWYRSAIDKPETGKYRVKLIGPNERSYGPKKNEIEVEVNLINHPASHAILGVPALPYVGLGTYYFEVEKKSEGESSWSPAARLPLLVREPAKKD